MVEQVPELAPCLHCGHHGGGRTGDAGHALHEVESDALAHQQAARAAPHLQKTPPEDPALDAFGLPWQCRTYRMPMGYQSARMAAFSHRQVLSAKGAAAAHVQRAADGLAHLCKHSAVGHSIAVPLCPVDAHIRVHRRKYLA
jgi:hypothetical protein